MAKIDTSRYVASHGSEPKPGQFGQWILENASGSRSISRTCYWRQLKAMKLEFEWFLKP
jgi:hypothetical protein